MCILPLGPLWSAAQHTTAFHVAVCHRILEPTACLLCRGTVIYLFIYFGIVLWNLFKKMSVSDEWPRHHHHHIQVHCNRPGGWQAVKRCCAFIGAFKSHTQYSQILFNQFSNLHPRFFFFFFSIKLLNLFTEMAPLGNLNDLINPWVIYVIHHSFFFFYEAMKTQRCGIFGFA